MPDLHRPSPPPIHTTQEQSSQELLVGLNTEWLPAEPNAQQDESQPEGRNGQTEHRILKPIITPLTTVKQHDRKKRRVNPQP